MSSRSLPLLVVVLFAASACTDSSNPVDVLEAVPDSHFQPLDLPRVDAAPAGDAQAAAKSQSDGPVVYTFDDLPTACFWDRLFPETYQDLAFSDSRYIGTCAVGSGNGLVPVSMAKQTEQTQTRITLPGPATEVSVAHLGIRLFERDRILVAYDASGNEIDRAVGRGSTAWSRLTVAGEIREVAIVDYQAQSYWDDLTVTFGGANQAPVADAGSSRSIIVAEEAALDGSASYDPDGDPISFTWTLVARPDGSLAEFANPTSAATSFTTDLPGTYTAQLVVNDGAADSAPASVSVEAQSLDGAVSSLKADVDALYTAGVLNKGQAGSLLRMLNMVERTAETHPRIALNKLNAFTGHVNGYMEDGILSAEQADALIQFAGRIAAAIESRAGLGGT